MIKIYSSSEPSKLSFGSLMKGLVLDMPLTSKRYNAGNSKFDDLTPYENRGTNTGGDVNTDHTTFIAANSDNVDCGNDSSLDMSNNNFTIGFWLKGSPFTMKDIIGKKDVNGGYSISQAAEKVLLFYGDASAYRYANIKQVNEWTHYVFIREGLTIPNAYVNGELLNGSFAGDGTAETGNSASNLRLSGGGHYGGFFTGDISGAKIWNRALNSEEVLLLFEKQKGQFL